MPAILKRWSAAAVMFTLGLVALTTGGCGVDRSTLERENAELKITIQALEAIPKETQELKITIRALETAIQEIETAVRQSHSGVRYQLYDFRREEIVGYLMTTSTLSKGDRLFLGDDMWDVANVKVFTDDEPLEHSSGTYYSLSTVQLLVTFGGKATTPKEGK